MQVEKTNRAFMYKQNNGRFVVYVNVEGEQKRIALFPNIGEDGMSVDHWGGVCTDNVLTEEQTSDT